MREVLDFQFHLRQLIQKLEIEVPPREQVIETPENNSSIPKIFSRYLRQLRNVRDWYDSTIERLDIQTPPKTPHVIPHRLQFTQRKDTITIPAPTTEGMYEDMLMNLDVEFWNSVYNDKDDWMTPGSQFWKPGV